VEQPDARVPFAGPPHTRQLLWLDLLAALAAFLLLPQPPQPPAPAWWCYLLAAGIALPLVVRRRWPVPVFAVVLTLSVVASLLDATRDPFAAAAFALYPVALTVPRRRWLPVIGVGTAALGLLLIVAGPAGWWLADASRWVTGSVLLGGAWVLGRGVRERRALAVQAATRQAERAVALERLRIARELHDVVTNGLGVIAVKAAVANHVVGQCPQEAHRALRVIESTSRDALDEMRHLLGVLRSDETVPDLAPAPGAGRLPELVRRATAAGIDVDVDVSGVETLPEGVGLSVYRIVQEALTNVARHAATARCRVRVNATAGEVRVEVSDDGSGGGGRPTAGHGLIGMRERVAVYGGTFAAGPRPEGGFTVTAHLPYGPPG
jgi:signal transduction histidine kinase